MSKLTIRTETSGTVAVISLQGTLDAGSAIFLAQTLESLHQASQYQLVLELQQLWEIDAVGLQVLHCSQQQAQEKGGDLRLASLSYQLTSLVEESKLNERFLCYPSLKEGLQSYHPKKKPRRIRLPFSLGKEIGLGDLIKVLTSAVGIKPCKGCEQRAEKLNEKFVIGRRKEPSQSPELPDG